MGEVRKLGLRLGICTAVIFAAHYHGSELRIGDVGACRLTDAPSCGVEGVSMTNARQVARSARIFKLPRALPPGRSERQGPSPSSAWGCRGGGGAAVLAATARLRLRRKVAGPAPVAVRKPVLQDVGSLGRGLGGPQQR